MKSKGQRTPQPHAMKSWKPNTYLKVPTPPASNKKAVCVNGFSIHLIANALKICPCATIRTSQFELASPFGLPIAGAWYVVLISLINLSNLSAICSGDLLRTRHVSRCSLSKPQTSDEDVLPTRAPILPNVKRSQTRSLPLLPDLLPCEALILSIIPLPNIIRNRHLRIRMLRLRPILLPLPSQVQELKCPLRAIARAHVSSTTEPSSAPRQSIGRTASIHGDLHMRKLFRDD